MTSSKYVPISLLLVATTCFIVGSIAVAIPYWGHFRNRVVQEYGHFGPWAICKHIDAGRKMCGYKLVMYKPTFVVKAAGICGIVGVSSLGFLILFFVFYLFTRKNAKSSTLVYILIVVIFLAFSSALTAITSVGLFATELGDNLDRGYTIHVGVAFYLEVIVAIFSMAVLLLASREFVWVKSGGFTGRGGQNMLDEKSKACNNANLHIGGEKIPRGFYNGSENMPLFNSRTCGTHSTSRLNEVCSINNCKQNHNCMNSHNLGRVPYSNSNSSLNHKNYNHRIPGGASPRFQNMRKLARSKDGLGFGSLSRSRDGLRFGSLSRSRDGLGFGSLSSLVKFKPSPHPSPGGSRRGSHSKCNKYPEPLHFACIDADAKDRSWDLLKTPPSPSPSNSSQRRNSNSKCNRYPEPLHFACVNYDDDRTLS